MLPDLFRHPAARYVSLAALLFVSSRLISRFLNAHRIANLLRIARQLKAEQLINDIKRAAKEWGGRELNDKSADEAAILSQSARSLIEEFRAAKRSATQIASAFIRQAIRLNQRSNALSETNFAVAIEDAKKLDALTEAERIRLPLCGLPVSVKDSVNLQGLDSTLGLVNFVNVPSAADALIVQRLRSVGAFVHTKTNVPQTLLSFECRNPLFGITSNPINPKFTSGGSSGGESALILGGGSVVGIGTDIGGSVRIPAHFCGNIALKPTSRRISTQGFRASVPGQEAVPGVAGIISNTVDDLCLVLKELLVPEVWSRDPDVMPMPLNMTEVSRGGLMRVGYWIDDDFLPASPPCRRAVEESVEMLRKSGHAVIEFKPPSILRCVQLYYQLMSADYANTMTKQLANDEWEDYTHTLVASARAPRPIKQVTAFIAGSLMNDSRAATLLLAAGESSVSDYWALQVARKSYRQLWLDEWNKPENQFDCLLNVAHLLPAVKHFDYKSISFSCAPTMIYNLLDWPAGIVPITFVKENEIWNEPSRGILDGRVRKCYDPQQQVGLPVGIQVAAPPHREESVLRAMRIIESLAKFKKPIIDGL